MNITLVCIKMPKSCQKEETKIANNFILNLLAIIEADGTKRFFCIKFIFNILDDLKKRHVRYLNAKVGSFIFKG